MTNDLHPEALESEQLMARLNEAVKVFSRPNPSRVRRTGTKRELIERSRDSLRALLRARGLRWVDLAALLAQCGLPVHPSTLKRCLGPIGRSRVSKQEKTQQVPKHFSRQGNRPRGESCHQFRPARGAAPSASPRPDGPVPVTLKASAPPMPSLVFTSQFVPKAEVPYEELMRRANERQQQAEAAAGQQTSGLVD